MHAQAKANDPSLPLIKRVFEFFFQIIQMHPAYSLDLTTAAQSLLLGPDFLLLIPHPTPSPPDSSDSNITSNASILASLWRQWPPPHPIAFAGGPLICPALRRAWMDPEDPKSQTATVFQPQGEAYLYEENSVKLAMNEEALKKPMALLSLSCYTTVSPTV